MLIFLLACTGALDSSEISDTIEVPVDRCENKNAGTLVFPEVDAPHAEVPEERWSWAGRVADTSGQAFRVSLDFRSVGGQTTAVATLLPEADAQRGIQEEGEGSATSSEGFVLEAGGLSAAGGGGRDVLTVQAAMWSWELVVAERKSVIVHQETGKWTGYSRPRMSAHGRVVDAAGTTVEVEGELWFEHLWGGASGPEQRVQLSLADGRDFRVLYDGSQTRVQGLRSDCTALEPDTASWLADLSWSSPATGCSWPVAGTVAVGAESWALAPLLQDQELPQAGGAFWWGAMAVSGSGPGTAFLRVSEDCP
ncbi:MAG TPA: lipocalin family protein [Myxococcota bacterium]|nr:lipocalin family protein [Myxococcota bacterium]